MSGGRDLGSHVQDMVESCERIILFVAEVSDEKLLDPKSPLQGAILYQLMILGEAAKQVPEALRVRYGDIPWRRIAGLRDKIVHYYFGLNEGVVLWAVRTGVPTISPATPRDARGD
ncbi:MAG: DUF86 domain-containing protein [Actinomycetota bacterium]|nr:MAG: hypothetical protein FD171_1113 [Actinomycetota bacterium]MDO8949598.1 DUF86 domain-containing protein [Actinomycetota bacterium]MDP3630772.1 DUF86 domain-containing protein [Actinomycetota bacterium]